MEYTPKPSPPELLVRKIVCFFKGHKWKGTWSPVAPNLTAHSPRVSGGYLEIYCTRCLDGMALSMRAQMSGEVVDVDWWVFRNGVRVPIPNK